MAERSRNDVATRTIASVPKTPALKKLPKAAEVTATDTHETAKSAPATRPLGRHPIEIATRTAARTACQPIETNQARAAAVAS